VTIEMLRIASPNASAAVSICAGEQKYRFLRLRWSLDDTCSSVRELRVPHRPRPDVQHALRARQSSLSQLSP
jgi:hypothetical protein